MAEIDGHSLSVNAVRNIAFLGQEVRTTKEALQRLRKNRESLEKLLESGKTVYGVNTGFGSLYNVKVPQDKIGELQMNLIRSHASGVGEPLSREYVRAMMTIRANTFLYAHSAVSENLLQSLLDLINKGLVPYVPEIGSVGASGDLAPLSHVALSLAGEGEFLKDGKRYRSAAVLKENGLAPYKFSYKEGVAFINGTAAISGILAVEIARACDLIKLSAISAAISFSALRGNAAAYTKWAVESRNHAGQAKISRVMRELLAESGEGARIQDPYSLRCIPQVHGAVLDTLEYARNVLEIEMNSATDNPLVKDGEVISAGNFHGEPVAFACDFLAIALTDLGNICERRTALLVDKNMSGLPAFLTRDSGLSSGYMIPQYVSAALCNYNKTLAHPASVDTIPTSASQEDHVSMGMTAALKLSRIVANLKKIIAIELLLSIQAAEVAGVPLGNVLSRTVEIIRKEVPELKQDRPPYVDIEKICELVSSDGFEKTVLEQIRI
ncbi:MAG: histidine ammonia-lyase [Candidatus Thermoplasmatota archaeon]|nr:histidine ammonia-lyase [Candidatus Thermoplasmatota archaeon]